MVDRLEVIRPGPLALIQDEGRFGQAPLGVGRSGAADRASFAQANELVGNDPAAAVIECTLGGLQVRAHGDLWIALAGAPVAAMIDRSPASSTTAVELRDGQVLVLRTPSSGLRTYLAVRGGIDVEPVLGSRSTDTLSGLGPAPLAAGAMLPIGPRPVTEMPPPARAGVAADQRAVVSVADSAAVTTQPKVVTLRVLAGPRDDWFEAPEALTAGEWVVSPHSSRVGLRLDRPIRDEGDEPTPVLSRRIHGELPSEGIVLGAIQIASGGQPVLFLADHPVTGGYPVVAVVLDADIDLAAQARPGSRLRFVGADTSWR